MNNKNLKDAIINNDFTNKKKKDNYSIHIPKSDFNDIIFSLNTLIIDIKNNQNNKYLISQIQKLIFKLKYFDVPQEIQLNTIPTFSTILIPDDNSNMEKKDSCDPMDLDLQKLGLDIKSIYSEIQSYDSKNDRNKYEGPLVNGKKEGKGIYIYHNGCRYEGFYKNDKKEGHGIYYYSNGDRYIGDFKNGFYQGKGIFYFKNGDRYEGEFNKNKYEGNGNYFYHNGDKFEGMWLNDKKNGKGVYTYLNGEKIKGNYKNGKPVGTHIKYYTDGRTINIKYSEE